MHYENGISGFGTKRHNLKKRQNIWVTIASKTSALKDTRHQCIKSDELGRNVHEIVKFDRFIGLMMLVRARACMYVSYWLLPKMQINWIAGSSWTFFVCGFGFLIKYTVFISFLTYNNSFWSIIIRP